jgi:hypothetical protein
MSGLSGSRDWIPSANPKIISDQFIAACGVLATYARDGQRIQKLSEQRGSTLLEIGSRYFSSLAIEAVADLVYAIEVLWRTPPEYHADHLEPFLGLIPIHNRNLEVVSAFLEETHEDALEQLLNRVWKSPSSFIGQPEFFSVIADWVMAFSLPATEFERPLTAGLLGQALEELVLDVERSKADPVLALQIASIRGQTVGPPFTRELEREIKKAFRKRTWTPLLQSLYDLNAEDLNHRLSHVAKLIDLFDWKSLQVPTFRGTPGEGFR